MKTKKLLRTVVLSTLLLGGAQNALADWDGTSPVYCPTNDTNYGSLTEATNAWQNATGELQLYGDSVGKLSLDNRITALAKGATLTITPMRDVTISRGKAKRTSMWVLAKQGATLKIGSNDHTITFQGGGWKDNQNIRNKILAIEGASTMYATNLIFKDFEFASENTSHGYLHSNQNGSKMYMKDITVDHCKTSQEAFILNSSNSGDAIRFEGKLDFVNGCEGLDIQTSQRLRLGFTDDIWRYSKFTAATPITMKWTGNNKIGELAIIKADPNEVQYFNLVNEDLGLFHNGNVDICFTQAYTANVSAAGAGTMVIPFEATIPEGIETYTLNFTGGTSTQATAVTEKLAANTPVYLKAAEGSYKFVSTATEGDLATGTDAVTVGALTGVYAATTVPQGSYVLQNGSEGLSFYKVASEITCPANKAYLSAEAASAKAITINYDGEATGIESAVIGVQSSDAAIYNLAGQRVSKDYKGVVIKNGKKYINK